MSSSRGPGRSNRPSSKTIRLLVESLETHRVNTLTELCRIEQAAVACEWAEDGRAFTRPMTAAWRYYVVDSRQLLSELRGLTPGYPFAADLLEDAQQRVLADPRSNRSWNLAWLCLTCMREDLHDLGADPDAGGGGGGGGGGRTLLARYAAREAARPEMWAGYEPHPAERQELARRFEQEWTQAVDTLLRHWPTDPTWC